MTGVMYLIASRTASIATSKQSVAVEAATTGIGVSPWRPNSAMLKSDCSVFVGRPVDGPPRCVLTITNGSSDATANEIPSDFSAIPGPALEVTPREPAKDAPIAEHTAAISSSA